MPPHQELIHSSPATFMLTNIVGSCFVKQIPKDDDIAAVPSQVVNAKCMVRLFGSESCPFTSRIWIALQCKGFDVRVVWLTSDVVLQYIETKFLNPHLVPDGPMADITLDWVVYIQDIFSPLVTSL